MENVNLQYYITLGQTQLVTMYFFPLFFTFVSSVITGGLRRAARVQRPGLRRGVVGQRLRRSSVSWRIHCRVQVPPVDRRDHIQLLQSMSQELELAETLHFTVRFKNVQ